MASKIENMKALMANGKSRMIIIFVVVLMSALIIGGLANVRRKAHVPAQLAGSAEVSTPPQIQNSPGSSSSTDYNKLQDESNDKNAQKAMINGNSNVPVLVNNDVLDKKDPLDVLSNHAPAAASAASAVAPSMAATPIVVSSAPIVPKQATPQIAQVRNDPNRQQSMEAVNKQVSIYMGLWGAGNSSQEFDYTGKSSMMSGGGSSASRQEAGGAGEALAGSANSASGALAAASTEPAFVHEGDIVPGAMITEVNTDEPGPVLAEIVAGPLKGARVIGSMRSSNQAVVIEFHALSLPNAPHAYQIDAFAVDPNTDRTSVATDVNNHLMLRYVLPLAAAFISGYGQAIATQGATTSTTAAGTTTTYGSLNNGQVAKAALGQTGTSLGQSLQQDSNRAPTVTVAAGTPIGLLFMADF